MIEPHRALALAELRLTSGNSRGAIDLLRMALSQEPDHPEAHALLAIALLDERRFTAAHHEAGLALAIDPAVPGALYALGEVCIARRRFVRGRLVRTSG